MNITYLVELTQEELHSLKTLLSKGIHNARLLKRANILLLANEHQQSDKDISQLLNTSTSTIYRTKKRFVEDGLEVALAEGKRTGQPKLLSANEDAKLISIACSEPPDGRARWTLSLIADKLITLTELESVSLETVRQRLKHNELKPWQKKMWCIGELNSDFIAQMEEVLEIYAMPADEKHPVVNFDEAMKQLVSHVKPPKLASPGHLAKDDYEYRREDVANIYLMYDKIHLVLDNYTTHSPGSLYKAYPAEEARRIVKAIEFHDSSNMPVMPVG
jgi:transposase